METEPQKIAMALTDRGFKEGWSAVLWRSAIEQEINRYRDEIEEIRHCDKCELCEDHHD